MREIFHEVRRVEFNHNLETGTVLEEQRDEGLTEINCKGLEDLTGYVNAEPATSEQKRQKDKD